MFKRNTFLPLQKIELLVVAKTFWLNQKQSISLSLSEDFQALRFSQTRLKYNIKFISPREPGTVVLQGAVFFGYNLVQFLREYVDIHTGYVLSGHLIAWCTLNANTLSLMVMKSAQIFSVSWYTKMSYYSMTKVELIRHFQLIENLFQFRDRTLSGQECGKGSVDFNY